MLVDSNANAAPSIDPSGSRPAQRAEVSAPSCGTVAPARTPAATSTGSGARALPATMSTATAAACAAALTGRTRGWPNRSTTRAANGPTVASATANPPTTTPARAKDPVA